MWSKKSGQRKLKTPKVSNVGRKRILPLEAITELFEANLDAIIKDGKVIAPSDPIWKKMGGKLKYKKTPKSLYNDALSWWVTKKLENSGKSDSKASVSEASESEANDFDASIEAGATSNSDSDASYLSQDAAPQADDIIFTISLSKEAWKIIEPHDTEHKRHDKSHKTNTRTYPELKHGVWTDVLVDKIAAHRIKNPCTWSFKRAKVTPNGKKYIDIFATCTTCDSNLFGEVSEEPKKDCDEVKFKFIVRGFNKETHDTTARKSVRVGGLKAKEIFSSKQPASRIKRDLIKSSGAEMFEPEKGRTINENAIRAGQTRMRQKDKLSQDPIRSLQFLKASHTFGAMIHGIGLDPFYIMYGSPNQFMLFDAYVKNNTYTEMAGDASGQFVHKLSK